MKSGRLLDIRAIHATGIDQVFKERLRVRFAINPLLYHHSDHSEYALKYNNYEGKKTWVPSDSISWTVPIHIESSEYEEDNSFDSLVDSIREDPLSFAEPFLEFVRGNRLSYLTHIKYKKENETTGVIYMTFVVNEYLKGNFDDDEEEVKEEIEEIKRDIETRFNNVMNIMSEYNMLYKYDWFVEANEISIEKNVAKLSVKVRKNKTIKANKSM